MSEFINTFLADPRLNGVAAMCAVIMLVLYLMVERQRIVSFMGFITRVLAVLIAQVVVYSAVVYFFGVAPAKAPLDLPPALYMGLLAASFSIFGILAVISEYRSWRRALILSTLTEAFYVMLLFIGLQLLSSQWNVQFTFMAFGFAVSFGLIGGGLTYCLNWLSIKFDNLIDSL